MNAPPSDSAPARAAPRVVIVGAGFGGLNVARELARSNVDVLVIDRRNHHLFQPLLYQVATAALSPADIAVPIRKILRDQRNARVFLGEVSAVDLARRIVIVGEREIAFDWLVLAAGATHSYFGHPEWAAFAPGLKTIEDATEIRRRFLLAFERAEAEDDPVARAEALTFVVVGGGPTGVELAGAMAEIARNVIPADFRAIDTSRARVVLIEGADRVLSAMSVESSRTALEHLRRLGVEVELATLVTAIDASGVVAGDRRIAARNVFWAAGVAASPLSAALGAPRDRAGRVEVGPDLAIPGSPHVFVIGDQARVVDPRTHALVPGVAQGAIQMGSYAGRVIARAVRAHERGEPAPARAAFTFRDKGTLATIGRSLAVADLGRRRWSGFAAWAIWALVHITFLIQFRNRVFVMMSWIWSYIFYDRGARLITGSPRVDEERASAGSPR